MEEAEDKPTRIAPTGKRGGKWVTLGAEAYRIPPVPFAMLKDEDFKADLLTLAAISSTTMSSEQIGTAERFIHAAIVRNYPEITVEQVADMLDLGNILDVLSTALAVSGFQHGTAGASGEPTASTGTASTAN